MKSCDVLCDPKSCFWFCVVWFQSEVDDSGFGEQVLVEDGLGEVLVEFGDGSLVFWFRGDFDGFVVLVS